MKVSKAALLAAYPGRCEVLEHGNDADGWVCTLVISLQDDVGPVTAEIRGRGKGRNAARRALYRVLLMIQQNEGSGSASSRSEPPTPRLLALARYRSS